MDKSSIFKDIRIVELASVLAGPSVGSFFAELGAEVTKIENPATKGDITRHWKLPSEDEEKTVSAYYSSINYKKKVLLLDLSTPDALKELYQLVKGADIIISNYKEKSAKKLGINYQAIKSINPTIIYAHLTGYPQGDSRPAFDVVLQAETGFMSMNGTHTEEPIKMPLAFIDILAAHQLKEAILIGLLRREKEGRGAHITCNLYQSAIASLANQASNYLMEGFIPKPQGSLHPNIAPYGETFTTKDGDKVVLAIGTDKQFKALCSILKAQKTGNNPNYASNELRVKNRSELEKELSSYFNNFSTEPLLTACKEEKVPIGKINNLQEVFENPVAKNMVLEEKIEGVSTKRVATAAFEIE